MAFFMGRFVVAALLVLTFLFFVVFVLVAVFFVFAWGLI
jgi:hypothetical protein